MVNPAVALCSIQSQSSRSIEMITNLQRKSFEAVNNYGIVRAANVLIATMVQAITIFFDITIFIIISIILYNSQHQKCQLISDLLYNTFRKQPKSSYRNNKDAANNTIYL